MANSIEMCGGYSSRPKPWVGWRLTSGEFMITGACLSSKELRESYSLYK